jgi:hypothetical protein
LAQARIEELAQPDDAKHSLALERAANFVERLDKSLKNATVRRNNLLKILQYYCRPTDQETEIPDTDYNEVTQDKLKQIAAPAVVPPELVTDDSTAQNQTEKVELATE